MPKKRQRQKPCPKSLDRAFGHVQYEIRMLLYTAGHLEHGHSSPATSPTDDGKNMALECFLVHFRNLRDFLCPAATDGHQDDILGSHFVYGAGRKDVAERSEIMKDAHRLNTMLAHLSYCRDEYIQAKDYHWPVPTMLAHLAAEFRSFACRINQSKYRDALLAAFADVPPPVRNVGLFQAGPPTSSAGTTASGC